MMGAERSLVTVFLSRMWANGLILKASNEPVNANPAGFAAIKTGGAPIPDGYLVGEGGAEDKSEVICGVRRQNVRTFSTFHSDSWISRL